MAIVNSEVYPRTRLSMSSTYLPKSVDSNIPVGAALPRGDHAKRTVTPQDRSLSLANPLSNAVVVRSYVSQSPVTVMKY